MTEDSNGDNDADKRPRVYGRIATRDRVVEATVQGAEGETTDDVEDAFERRIDDLVEKSKDVAEPDERREVR